MGEQEGREQHNPAGPEKVPEPGTHKEQVLKGPRERQSGWGEANNINGKVKWANDCDK